MSKFILPRIFGVVLCGALALTIAGRAAADPDLMTDQELDSVSAKGFSYPSYGYGNIQPITTTVVPFVPTSAQADTDVKNLNIAIANTTNVVTAINQCIFSTCTDTSADVTASPSTQNQIEVHNDIAPMVSNSTSVPININLPNFGQTGGGLPFAAFTSPSQSGSGTAGFVKSRPALPAFGFGGR